MPMFRLYAWQFPYWFSYELIVNSYGLVRLLFFEDQKVEKLKALILGTFDGLHQRMGPISNSRFSAIQNVIPAAKSPRKEKI